MARLTVNTDLSFPITRQTLFSMWEDATVTGITEDDLGPDFRRLLVGSTFSDAPTADIVPGQLFFHQQDQLVYCWTDELENTAVSLWLAIGPDVFETACLAAEPIPAGAVVEPFYDRWVNLAAPSNPPDVDNAFLGINQSGLPDPSEPWPGNTSASGVWIRVAIDGLPRAWYPSPDSGVSEQHFGAGTTGGVATWAGVLDGGRFKGGLGQPVFTTAKCDRMIGNAVHAVTHSTTESQHYIRVKWYGGLINNP